MHVSFGTFADDTQVKIEHKADWWLGDLEDPWFQSLEAAIHDEWGVDPLRIREGGVCCLHSTSRMRTGHLRHVVVVNTCHANS